MLDWIWGRVVLLTDAPLFQINCCHGDAALLLNTRALLWARSEKSVHLNFTFNTDYIIKLVLQITYLEQRLQKSVPAFHIRQNNNNHHHHVINFSSTATVRSWKRTYETGVEYTQPSKSKRAPRHHWNCGREGLQVGVYPHVLNTPIKLCF